MGQTRETIRDHLAKMAELPNPPNADLSPGFTVSQVAEKHNWTEPMVWSLTLEGRDDLEKFKEGGWGLSTWDEWEWNDCLPRLTSLFLLFNWGMSMTAKRISLGQRFASPAAKNKARNERRFLLSECMRLFK